MKTPSIKDRVNEALTKEARDKIIPILLKNTALEQERWNKLFKPAAEETSSKALSPTELDWQKRIKALQVVYLQNDTVGRCMLKYDCIMLDRNYEDNLKLVTNSAPAKQTFVANPLSVIVLLSKTYSHTYPLNTPVIVKHGSNEYAWLPDGKQGNKYCGDYNTFDEEHIRFATPEEITGMKFSLQLIAALAESPLFEGVLS